jgi:prolipoprotein diacylglyceryl transferase
VVSLVIAAVRAGQASRRDAGLALAPLRRDDLLYIVVGALPGAIIGGRLVHGLDYLDFYLRASQPSALLDPTRGSLSLLGAVVGGTLTAMYVAWLIGAPIRRWLDVAIVPLLIGIALGKLAMLLGGGGQGAPADLPWAIAFTGPGPWRSLGADLPAHPSQVYEAFWTLLGIPVVLAFTGPSVWSRLPDELRNRAGLEIDERDRARRDYDVDVADLPAVEGATPGLLFLVGLAWWAVGRILVGLTWRDQPVVVGFNAEQLAAVALLVVLTLVLLRALFARPESAY